MTWARVGQGARVVVIDGDVDTRRLRLECAQAEKLSSHTFKLAAVVKIAIARPACTSHHVTL